MKCEIRNRFSDKVMFAAEIDCDKDDSASFKLRLAVERAVRTGVDLLWANLDGANLKGANLYEANLKGATLKGANLKGASLKWANLDEADLCGANLKGADLYGVSGTNKYIKSMNVDIYPITYTAEAMQIGCENHSISDWVEFDDDRIIEMNGKTALKFWRSNKEWIFQTIEKFPAQPTNHEKQEVG